MVIIIMGVSGSGKTTIGQLLEKKMSYVFVDADDYHSDKNKLKMINNVALNQEDREPWLKSIRILLDKYIENKKITVIGSNKANEDTAGPGHKPTKPQPIPNKEEPMINFVFKSFF